MVRPMASPLPLRVTGKRGFALGSGRYRRFIRRDWKSANREHELISRYPPASPSLGSQTSMSWVMDDEKLVSPAARVTTR